MSENTFSAPELQQESAAPVKKTTLYDSLKASFNKPPVLKAFGYIDIPGRDFGLKIDADLSAEIIDRVRVRHSNKKTGKINTVDWYSELIAKQTEVFVTKAESDDDREEVYDNDGNALNFYHAEVREGIGALDTPSTVRELFGRDAHVLKAGDQLMQICGYTDGDDEDPLDSEND